MCKANALAVLVAVFALSIVFCRALFVARGI
jgi:hypothetical protein